MPDRAHSNELGWFVCQQYVSSVLQLGKAVYGLARCCHHPARPTALVISAYCSATTLLNIKLFPNPERQTLVSLVQEE
jgi:hypothetical protein